MVTEQIITEDTARMVTSDAMISTDAITTDVMVTTGAMVTEKQQLEFFDILSWWLYILILPIITLVGVIGNSLSIVTVQRSSLKSSSVAVFITALAVVDNIVLIMDFLNNWVERMFSVDVRALTDAGCRTYRVLFHIVYTSSAWFVTAMAVERFIVVWFPFKARTLCTRKSAIIVTCVSPVIIALVYAYQIVGWSLVSEENCNFNPDHMYIMATLHPWIAAIMYSYGPIIIVVFCTISVSLQLYRMKKRRAEMTSQTSQANARDLDAEMKITVLIIVTCALFIVLTVPMTIFYAILLSAGGHIYQGPVMALIETIILILVLSNHAINFFLYVLSSDAFRKELQILCKKNAREGGIQKNSSSGSDTAATKVSSVSDFVSQNDDKFQI